MCVFGDECGFRFPFAHTFVTMRVSVITLDCGRMRNFQPIHSQHLVKKENASRRCHNLRVNARRLFCNHSSQPKGYKRLLETPYHHLR
jgi:hypothetical protein